MTPEGITIVVISLALLGSIAINIFGGIWALLRENFIQKITEGQAEKAERFTRATEQLTSDIKQLSNSIGTMSEAIVQIRINQAHNAGKQTGSTNSFDLRQSEIRGDAGQINKGNGDAKE